MMLLAFSFAISGRKARKGKPGPPSVPKRNRVMLLTNPYPNRDHSGSMKVRETPPAHCRKEAFVGSREQ
jgi:hypothetical protein